MLDRPFLVARCASVGSIIAAGTGRRLRPRFGLRIQTPTFASPKHAVGVQGWKASTDAAIWSGGRSCRTGVDLLLDDAERMGQFFGASFRAG